MDVLGTKYCNVIRDDSCGGRVSKLNIERDVQYFSVHPQSHFACKQLHLEIMITAIFSDCNAPLSSINV